MEKFIARVREHPCLWDLTHPDYREMQVKDDAWMNVVIDCNDSSIPNVKVARAKWRKLRDSHSSALRRAKLGRNKLLPAQITTWKYARVMQFLEPHMKYRITENIDSDNSEERRTNNEPDGSTTDDCINANITNKHKRRHNECPNDMSSEFQQDGDALETFFCCMLKSTRQMPSWMQTQVKKKIFAVIIEAEERLSSEQSSDRVNDYDMNPIKTEAFTEDSSDYL